MPNLLRVFPRHLALASLFLALTSGAVRAEHYETWIEVKSPHFTIYSNAGEHDGRRVAAQFEEIRALFEQNFPKLRVDFGKPTLVFVLKDENSLKLLMPTYGQGKNAKKLAGYYQATFDRNFAVVRTDVTGTGTAPYHVMYHEWAHGLFRLNYRGLPLWLDEGLAEYWGGSDIDNKEGRVGMADPRQIRILQQGPFIPIETLVSIDGSSPLYNTQDHAGMFYAESWAMVHYFALAPEARDQHLLDKYLVALQETDDPIEAANRSFGDLKKAGDKLQNYSRQQAFLFQKIALRSDISEKTFTARKLTPAEGFIALGDYLIHSNHLPEGIEALHEAEKLDAKTPGLHTEMGRYHYQKSDMENASKEFDLALAADPNDVSAYLFRAYILLRKSGYNKETTPQIIASLEKVIALQPDFAAAHAFLCVAYTQMPETKPRALAEARRAVQLEPGNLAYFIDQGKALLATGDMANAKKVAERAQKSAIWQRDRALAASFAKAVNAKANPGSSDTPPADVADSAAMESGAAVEKTATTAEKVGQITELLCGHPPSVMFTLAAGSEQFLLHVKDISKIAIKDASMKEVEDASCGKWKDRKASVTFTETPDGPAHGEVSSISFK